MYFVLHNYICMLLLFYYWLPVSTSKAILYIYIIIINIKSINIKLIVFIITNYRPYFTVGGPFNCLKHV